VCDSIQRWGDASVHTIGAALFAGVDQIHFFRDIGYKHYNYSHCPTGDLWKRGRCACDPAASTGTYERASHF
jgi:alpha 1,2-mannosyltransferase